MAPTLYTQLTINNSDGVNTVYPERTEKLVEPDGSYEYFRPIAPNESKSVMWLNKSANALMAAYDKPRIEYIFTDFPEHYKLFEHVKFRNGKVRMDTYLFGHPLNKRFRSVNEFVPHLRYLSGKDAVCTCAYCDRPSRAAPTTIRKRTKQEVALTAARRTIAIEERQKEQETAGWVLRKGEIIWVWVPDNREAEYDESDPLIDYDGGIWMAGIVAERPDFSPPLDDRKGKGSGLFNPELAEPQSPWSEIGEQTYTVQLCSKSAPGEILTGVRQHHVKPWLARPWCLPPPSTNLSPHPEHPTIPIARTMAESFSLFDPETPDAQPTAPIKGFKGAFLGPEKIFLHEPVRISHEHSQYEDVLVITKIYAENKRNKAGRLETMFWFRGTQYTAYPDEGCSPLTLEEFVALPFRMKRGSGTGEVVKWHYRYERGKVVEVSSAAVLGRWYEPEAVHAWTGVTGFAGGATVAATALCGTVIKRVVKNRREGLGIHSLNGIDLEITNTEVPIKPGHLTLPQGAKSVSASASATASDSEDNTKNEEPRISPSRNFKSVNLRIPSVSPIKMKHEDIVGESSGSGSERMLAEYGPGPVAGEEEEDDDYQEGEGENGQEEEESQEQAALKGIDKYRRPGPEVLSQSPTKRRRC